jgi:CO dehydrogenase maturation factor
MRLGIIGKGGSGKTTLSAALALTGAAQSQVLAIDADINQTLGPLLGFAADAITSRPSLGTNKDILRQHIRGNSARLDSADTIIKTTLPTAGGNLVRLSPTDPVLATHALWRDKLCLLPIGGFTEADIGVACYHSKTGMVELLLNHLPDTRDDLILTDFSAGADLFASGLFTRYDMLLLVIEPTRQSVQVAQQILAYSKPYDVCIHLAAHKLQSTEDMRYLHKLLGHAPDYALPFEPNMAAMARTGVLDLTPLSETYTQELNHILADLCTTPRDRAAYWAGAIDWHRRNAKAWANAATGQQLEAQIDEEFLSTLSYP